MALAASVRATTGRVIRRANTIPAMTARIASTRALHPMPVARARRSELSAAPMPAVLVRTETVPTAAPSVSIGITSGGPSVLGRTPLGIAESTSAPDWSRTCTAMPAWLASAKAGDRSPAFHLWLCS